MFSVAEISTISPYRPLLWPTRPAVHSPSDTCAETLKRDGYLLRAATTNGPPYGAASGSCEDGAHAAVAGGRPHAEPAITVACGAEPAPGCRLFGDGLAAAARPGSSSRACGGS